MLPNNWICFYFILINVHIFSQGFKFQEFTSSACYGINLPCTSHYLRCPVGYVITVLTAQYGHKQQCLTPALTCTDCCAVQDGDCLLEYNSNDYKNLFRQCSVQNECLFRAPSVMHPLCSGIQLQTLLTSVFSVITYRCIEVYSMGSGSNTNNVNNNNNNNNTNDDLPAVNPVKGNWNSKRNIPALPEPPPFSRDSGKTASSESEAQSGIDVQTMVIIVSSLFVFLFTVIVSAVLVKLGYCSRVLTRIKRKPRKRPTESQEPVYFECETVTGTVPDLLNDSLYQVNTLPQCLDHDHGSTRGTECSSPDMFYGFTVINSEPQHRLQTSVSETGNTGTLRKNQECSKHPAFYCYTDVTTELKSDLEPSNQQQIADQKMSSSRNPNLNCSNLGLGGFNAVNSELKSLHRRHFQNNGMSVHPVECQHNEIRSASSEFQNERTNTDSLEAWTHEPQEPGLATFDGYSTIKPELICNSKAYSSLHPENDIIHDSDYTDFEAGYAAIDSYLTNCNKEEENLDSTLDSGRVQRNDLKRECDLFDRVAQDNSSDSQTRPTSIKDLSKLYAKVNKTKKKALTIFNECAINDSETDKHNISPPQCDISETDPENKTSKPSSSNLSKRVSCVSTSSSLFTNYDQLGDNSETSSTEVDPNYDHLNMEY